MKRFKAICWCISVDLKSAFVKPVVKIFLEVKTMSAKTHVSQNSVSVADIPKLKDQELLQATADLVQRERHVLTLVLHHLREVERRRLFSDMGYPSLFEYCVRELKYSEGQTGRRIQAMRLLKELPEIQPMIRSGSLSLTNLSQAQSYFRDVQKQAHQKKGSENQGGQNQAGDANLSEDWTKRNQPLSRALKLEILQSLQNTPSREGQKKLIEIEQESSGLGAGPILPKDRERPLGQDYNQVCFAMSPELKEQLEVARSLIGVAGAQMNLNDLLLEVSKIAVHELEVKKFGKRRTLKKYKEREEVQDKISTLIDDELSTDRCHCDGRYNLKESRLGPQNLVIHGAVAQPKEMLSSGQNPTPTPALEFDIESSRGFSLEDFHTKNLDPKSTPSQAAAEAMARAMSEKEFTGDNSVDERQTGTDPRLNLSGANRCNPRYIPRSIQKAVWDRDGGKCVCCRSKRNLNFDHIQPVALGGDSNESNLRLLCFQCNQRQAIKTFGFHNYRHDRRIHSLWQETPRH